MSSTSGPIEGKVTASVAGSAVSTIVCWILTNYLIGVPLPSDVELAITMVIVALVTFLSGYMAKHTVRADPDAVGPVGKHSRQDETD